MTPPPPFELFPNRRRLFCWWLPLRPGSSYCSQTLVSPWKLVVKLANKTCWHLAPLPAGRHTVMAISSCMRGCSTFRNCFIQSKWLFLGAGTIGRQGIYPPLTTSKAGFSHSHSKLWPQRRRQAWWLVCHIGNCSFGSNSPLWIRLLPSKIKEQWPLALESQNTRSELKILCRVSVSAKP